MNKKNIGLALGGGSARGFAHIGVISVLEENGVPVDMVSGCSMGSVIGGIYTSGCEMSYLENFIKSIDLKKLFDYTVPSRGYVRGNRAQQMIRILTRDYSFKQTKRPFACIAVDIESGELVLFNEGPLHEAIRASISIPGVFVPHEYNGKTYVDGGVLDRNAIGAAREIGADFVIASDVGYRGEGLGKPRGIIQVLENSFTIAAWEIARPQLKKADYLIEVEVGDIDSNTTDYKIIETIIQRGRTAAQKALPEIKEKLRQKGWTV